MHFAKPWKRGEIIISKRHVFGFELTGAAAIIVAGALLHFVYGWTGGWHPVALIAAVNESIWEHLKLAFWPGLAWACLPSRAVTADLTTRLAVRGYSLLLAAVTIVAVFTGYTRILGDNLLLLDIGTFVVAVLAGQALAVLLLARETLSRTTIRIGLALLALQLAVYALFTYFPPDHWLFIDSRNGLRGILPA